MKRRFFVSMLLVLAMFVPALPAFAAEKSVNSNKTGVNGAETSFINNNFPEPWNNNIAWDVDENGTLTISGTGAMPEDGYYTPWYNSTESIKKVVINEGITSISNLAFTSCINLETVSLPDSLNKIGGAAFSYCTSLKDITIPPHVTIIGDKAFNSCSSLEKAVITNNFDIDSFQILGMDDGLFGGCFNLTDVTLPNNLTSIPDNMFYECSQLETVAIPEGVTKIGARAFERCYNLRNIKIPESVTEIEMDAFSQSGLSKIIMSENVTQIGSGAFALCLELTDIQIPTGITKIESSTFWDCIGLKDITIPENVTTIEENAFSDSGLTDITIPQNVTQIGSGAFANCVDLKTVAILGNFTSDVVDYYNGIFSDCTNLTDISLPEGLLVLPDYIFSGCKALKTIEIPKSLTAIGEGSFQRCSGLTDITIPEDVSEIGGYAFFECTSLTSINIPNGISEIGDGTFYSCTSLTNIKIPENVTVIGDNAFAYCDNLTDITIPESVTIIGDYAFTYCDNLTLQVFPSSYAEQYAIDNYIPYKYPTCAGVSADIPSGSRVIRGTKIALTTKTEGADIYYTLDGTDPTAEGASPTKYTEEITINEDMVITAYAAKSGLENSLTTKFIYSVGDTYNIPVNVEGATAGNTIIVAAYDGNTLLGCATQIATGTGSDTVNLEYSGNATEIKIMEWNSLSGMVPQKNVVTRSVNSK